jgi:preprotein translocase subunit YajC
VDVLLALLGIIAAFYFILLRPVINQQKRRKSDISSLNVGDEVLTTGGFYATVTDIRTTDEGPMEILLEAAPDVTLRATPEAVLEITTRVGTEHMDTAR